MSLSQKASASSTFLTAGDVGPIWRAAIFLIIAVGLSTLLTFAGATPLLPFIIGLCAIVYATTPLWYLLTVTEIKVKQGIWTSEKIAYSTIERAKVVESATSVGPPKKCIEIQFQNRVRRVIPQDALRFVDEIADRCPHLHRYGHDLRPGSDAADDSWASPPKPSQAR